MCEPTCSVVQYPASEPQIGAPNENRLRMGLGTTLSQYLKKIGNWFNLAHLASGHSESIEWAKTKHMILPTESARYEGKWWNREVHIDGRFCYGRGDLSSSEIDEVRKDSQESAEIYTHQICLGDLGKLRNFLEISVNNSDNHSLYLEKMPEALSKKGQEELFRKGAMILSSYELSRSDCDPSQLRWGDPGKTKTMFGFARYLSPKLGVERLKKVSQSALKAFLGLTRKREMLNDAWADESLWKTRQ